jgi:hypothetical protein
MLRIPVSRTRSMRGRCIGFIGEPRSGLVSARRGAGLPSRGLPKPSTTRPRSPSPTPTSERLPSATTVLPTSRPWALP